MLTFSVGTLKALTVVLSVSITECRIVNSSIYFQLYLVSVEVVAD